ncbi:hypothetical protein [Kitasatospora camelliae]|uniref:hypothetical protein n=1 Tax=Kitasatospora camelliae TaxID=3156397 RepID=UPI003B588451
MAGRAGRLTSGRRGSSTSWSSAPSGIASHTPAAVLRRRLAFLEAPSSLFHDPEGRPVTAEQEPDPFRRGMLLVARASGEAERAWLAETIAALDATPAPTAATER